MKFPPEHAKVQVGMFLKLCDGTVGEIIEACGNGLFRIDWDGKLSREEEYQEEKTIQKWVARGMWKLRRK